MKSDSGGFRAGVLSAGLSLFLNVAAFYGVDHAASGRGFRLASDLQKKNAESALEFEFVEAPPKAYPQAPSAETKKIAERDALAQNAVPNPDGGNAPKAAPGLTDQLAQNPFARPASSPAPAAKGSKAAEGGKESKADPSQAPPAAEAKDAIPAQKAAAPVPVPTVRPAPAEPGPGETPAAEDVLRIPERAPQAPAAVPASVPGSSAQAPSDPRQALPALTGRDKILTQEMARQRSPGAKLYGATSFEATGSGMGEYMKNLKEKVWLAWFPYLAFSYPADYKAAGCVLRFTLDTEGRIRIVQIFESHGSSVFSTFCVEAIQKAAPFGPLPQEILALVGKDELELFFGFHYQ